MAVFVAWTSCGSRTAPSVRQSSSGLNGTVDGTHIHWLCPLRTRRNGRHRVLVHVSVLRKCNALADGVVTGEERSPTTGQEGGRYQVKPPFI
jgi:hypothetical protein